MVVPTDNYLYDTPSLDDGIIGMAVVRWLLFFVADKMKVTLLVLLRIISDIRVNLLLCVVTKQNLILDCHISDTTQICYHNFSL
jgi:hypothetical protein